MSISPAHPSVESANDPVSPTGERIQLSDLSDIYEHGALALIGCGAAKRSPTDENDLLLASVGSDESFGPDWTDETGPAWKARDLYSSTYFRLKKQFARRIASVEGGREQRGDRLLPSRRCHEGQRLTGSTTADGLEVTTETYPYLVVQKWRGSGNATVALAPWDYAHETEMVDVRNPPDGCGLDIALTIARNYAAAVIGDDTDPPAVGQANLTAWTQ